MVVLIAEVVIVSMFLRLALFYLQLLETVYKDTDDYLSCLNQDLY